MQGRTGPVEFQTDVMDTPTRGDGVSRRLRSLICFDFLFELAVPVPRLVARYVCCRVF